MCLILKSLQPFLSLMDYEDRYHVEGFLRNLFYCFNIVFAQLGVIPRTRNKFVDIVAVAECYLITNHVKNKESKKQPSRICLPVTLAEECQ